MNTFLRELFLSVASMAGESVMVELCSGYLEGFPTKPLPSPILSRESVLEGRLGRLSRWPRYYFNFQADQLSMRYEEELKRIRILRRYAIKDPILVDRFQKATSEEEKTDLVEEMRARDRLTHDPERERDPLELTLEDEQQTPELMEEEILSYEEQHRQEGTFYLEELKRSEQERRKQEEHDLMILKRAWDHVKKGMASEDKAQILQSYAGILS